MTFRWIVAAAALTLLPQVATATPYTFQATETSALSPSPVDFTFTLDPSTAFVLPSGATEFTGVSIERNGMTSSGPVDTEYGTQISSSSFFLIDTSTTPFSSGSGSGLLFNTGTFSIAEGFTDGEGTLRISAGTPAPTPEPSTWILLLSGCGAIALAGRSSWRSRSSQRSFA